MIFRAIAILLSLIPLLMQANAANFFLQENPKGEGYLLFGNVTAGDVYYIPNVGTSSWTAQVLYTPKVSYSSWELKLTDFKCPSLFSSTESRGKQEMAGIWNSMLSRGIYLDHNAGVYSGQTTKLLTFYCTTNTPGYFGLWVVKFMNIPIVSRPAEAPRCAATMQSTINFGNVIIGNTAETSAQGIISCDSDTKVKVSLLNPGSINTSEKDGVLKLGDATVLFNVENAGTGKEYSVKKNINEPFTLNFKISETGVSDGRKTGNLILMVDIP